MTDPIRPAPPPVADPTDSTRWPTAARPPRAWLFVPADRVGDRLPKALDSGADVVIVDLEDGVDPARRASARADLGPALEAAGGRGPVAVRINRLGTAEAEDDLAAIGGLPIAALVLPKTEDPGVARRLIGAWPGPSPLPALVCLLETPRGVLAAAEIAAADSRIRAIALGAEDLAAAMGLRRSADDHEILVARSMVALAAAAAGILALDTPCLALDDAAAVERDAREAAALGFHGKLAVHPRQVASIRAAFRPTPSQVAIARATLAAADDSGDRGAFRRDGRMIDRPVVEAARRLLAEVDPGQEETES